MATPTTRKPRKETTIYTLAQEFGVTPGTVSRALRNRPEISINTRKIIRQRASEIGFKLRNFETRVTNICVLIETSPGQQSLFSTYVDSVLNGVWHYCGEQGIELSLFGEEEERLTACDLIRVLGRRGVNGAVVLNATSKSRYFSSLNDQNFPYCCVMSAPQEGSEWLIRADAQNLGRRATDHLLELGHTRIAFLDSLAGMDVGEQRKLGYLQAIEAAGLKFQPEWIVSAKDFSLPVSDAFDFGIEAVRTLLRSKSPPTAFISMSDESGLATVHALKAHGREVPKHASVISFDESRLCAFVSPPLTVVNVPYEQMGIEAAAIVHRRLEGNIRKNDNGPLTVHGDLTLRESTGPAPAD